MVFPSFLLRVCYRVSSFDPSVKLVFQLSFLRRNFCAVSHEGFVELRNRGFVSA